MFLIVGLMIYLAENPEFKTVNINKALFYI